VQLYNFWAVSLINVLPFVSGMFIPLQFFPAWLQQINTYNPFAAPYVLYDHIVLQGKAPSMLYITILSLASLTLLWVSYYFYKKLWLT